MTGWRKRTIMEMAREAGAVFPADGSYHQFERHEDLEAFANLVAFAEREACAKVCDHMAVRYEDMRGAALESAAQSIRARGNT